MHLAHLRKTAPDVFGLTWLICLEILVMMNIIINHISAVVRTSLYQFVFDPTWLDPVAGATVDSATGSSQVGSNTRVLKSSSEPGRAKYSFFIYARLGLSVGALAQSINIGLARVFDSRMKNWMISSIQ
eukprot:COSAG02_NODE_371_length_23642_cov_21.655227_4_plen_129_part_00